MVKFEWDENKNQTNIQKHGISFEEAITVFKDMDALIISDENHSDDEVYLEQSLDRYGVMFV